MGAGVELAWERSGALLGPSGHPLPALPLPDLQGGDTQDTQPQSPQVHDTGQPWEGFPRRSMGLLGAGCGTPGPTVPFTLPLQQPPPPPNPGQTLDNLPRVLPSSCFHPFPGALFVLSRPDPFFGELSKWSRKFGPSASLSRPAHWIWSLLRWESCN